MAKEVQSVEGDTASRSAGRANNGESGEVITEGEIVALQQGGAAIEAAHQASFQSFLDKVIAKADTTDEDQFAAMASIIHEIMQSQSPVEVLKERSSLHAAEVVGRPLLVHSFAIRAGDYEESQVGHYAALTCSTQGSTETRIVTCGGIKVLAKLMKLDEFGEWPQVVMFTEKTTSRGYGVLDIVSPQL